jgi:phosphate transport system protein
MIGGHRTKVLAVAELRREYRHLLAGLEDRLLTSGNRCQELLELGVSALDGGDPRRCEQVLRGVAEVTTELRRVDDELFRALALQAPVAGDLRLMSTLIHTGIHLARMTQLCRNVAKAAAEIGAVSGDPGLQAQIVEMGTYTRRLIGRALESLARRDVELAGRLHDLDEPVDQLNRAIFRRSVEYAAGDEERMNWSMRMVLVARYLERIGDHAVQIGERVVFAVTGE